MTKKALITGITGQDGAYLAELLLEKGYTVIGTFRRVVTTNFWRIEELGKAVDPDYADYTDICNASESGANAKLNTVPVNLEQPDI